MQDWSGIDMWTWKGSIFADLEISDRLSRLKVGNTHLQCGKGRTLHSIQPRNWWLMGLEAFFLHLSSYAVNSCGIYTRSVRQSQVSEIVRHIRETVGLKLQEQHLLCDRCKLGGILLVGDLNIDARHQLKAYQAANRTLNPLEDILLAEQISKGQAVSFTDRNATDIIGFESLDYAWFSSVRSQQLANSSYVYVSGSAQVFGLKAFNETYGVGENKFISDHLALELQIKPVNA
mmetsp:Transcript_40135/g.126233  ORF Transcript_40135/g.126233 Transcript_40135/m.126233 type:complete len:233 (-) Transcript_40135:1064-1762(-)